MLVEQTFFASMIFILVIVDFEVVVVAAVVKADFRGMCRAAWLCLLVTCALDLINKIRAKVSTNNNEGSVKCCYTLSKFKQATCCFPI